MQIWQTGCLVAGGGPAGMMLAYLLARSGVQTILVEKHGDFLRDFRGDTVHPSTTEVMHELGLLEEFLRQVPHETMDQLGIGFNGQNVRSHRFPPPTDGLQVRRLHAAVGFFELLGRQG
jgi:2-polyprenyl-6-methoxyphenol hydroxylase-like FAD-dependent oxidoreductase